MTRPIKPSRAKEKGVLVSRKCYMDFQQEGDGGRHESCVCEALGAQVNQKQNVLITPGSQVELPGRKHTKQFHI